MSITMKLHGIRCLECLLYSVIIAILSPVIALFAIPVLVVVGSVVISICALALALIIAVLEVVPFILGCFVYWGISTQSKTCVILTCKRICSRDLCWVDDKDIAFLESFIWGNIGIWGLVLSIGLVIGTGFLLLWSINGLRIIKKEKAKIIQEMNQVKVEKELTNLPKDICTICVTGKETVQLKCSKRLCTECFMKLRLEPCPFCRFSTLIHHVRE